MGQSRSDFDDFNSVSFPNKMLHQNKTSGIFKRRVMTFFINKKWLKVGEDHQKNGKKLQYKHEQKCK